ncbi:glycosyltransferase [Psychrobacter faecalis]|uniref:glycosyltransferase n=1 Tax=Psychrobacter faecalis TaxID=180588 RepID=UPI0028ADBC1B|nr:glycosyltransferase [Psychrobacter faecalis]
MSEISILIPTYKPSWYLERCLRSIENQSLPKDKFKVYIALNGPKDNFEEVIHSALDSTNFDYEFFYLELASVSNTRNYLIENSAEEYIVFVDDDDVISKNYLEELLKVSDATNIGIANVYNFSESLDDLKESYIGKSFEKLEKTTSSKYKSRKYFSSPWAKMIHRTIINDVRFDINLAIGEDSLFMAQLSNRVKSVRKTVETACYYVYEREGSATRQKIDKKKELKRIVYLLKEYSKMLLSFRYNTLFIMTRVAATLMHGRSLFG